MAWGNSYSVEGFKSSDMVISVWDKSERKKVKKVYEIQDGDVGDVCIGVVKIDLDELKKNETKQEMIPLWKHNFKKQKNFFLKLEYHYQEIEVFPPELYVPFVNFIVDPSMVFLDCVDDVAACQRHCAAKYVVRLLMLKHQWWKYLDKIIKDELGHCNQASTIFRGSGFGTSALLYFVKLVGKEYLQQTLATDIERLIVRKIPCLIQPDDTEDVKTEKAKHLKSYVSRFFKAIVNSAKYCPIQLRQVFNILFHAVSQKFDEQTSYFAINGFLFLRFFVPALKSPMDDIISINTPDEAKKLLSVIATAVQKMANGVTFRETDELAFLNEVMVNTKEDVDRFMRDISTVPDSSTLSAVLDIEELSFAEDAACMLSLLLKNEENFKNISDVAIREGLCNITKQTQESIANYLAKHNS
uniref:Ras-GAP domain-containing protein n=1 Tax=Arcella intermedia TaxID=1963864 RepID=A0A6B2L2Y1_9EUKA